MRAITIDSSGKPSIMSIPIPSINNEEILVENIAIGLCGTDKEIIEHQSIKPGMILGHESLGRVKRAPINSIFRVDDLVIGYIRRSCQEKCNECKQKNYAKCESNKPMERGIIGLDGFGSDYWVSEPEYLVKGNPKLGIFNILVEPLSSIMRGLRRINLNNYLPNNALIIGAGTIGLLTLAVLKQQGVQKVTIIDKNWNAKKLQLSETLGGNISYSIDVKQKYKLVIDAAGTASAFSAGINSIGKNGKFLVLGICHSSCKLEIIPANYIFSNSEIIFTVNATQSDYSTSVTALSNLDKSILKLFITQETSPESWWSDYLSHDGIKSIIKFSDI